MCWSGRRIWPEPCCPLTAGKPRNIFFGGSMGLQGLITLVPVLRSMAASGRKVKLIIWCSWGCHRSVALVCHLFSSLACLTCKDMAKHGIAFDGITWHLMASHGIWWHDMGCAGMTWRLNWNGIMGAWWGHERRVTWHGTPRLDMAGIVWHGMSIAVMVLTINALRCCLWIHQPFYSGRWGVLSEFGPKSAQRTVVPSLRRIFFWHAFQFNIMIVVAILEKHGRQH